MYEDIVSMYAVILTMLLTTFTYKAPVLGAITLVQHQKTHIYVNSVHGCRLRSWHG